MDSENKIVSLASGKKNAQKRKQHNEDVAEYNDSAVYCSFCGRPNTQVVKMVKGPGVNICSECTMIAVQYLILEDKTVKNKSNS